MRFQMRRFFEQNLCHVGIVRGLVGPPLSSLRFFPKKYPALLEGYQRVSDRLHNPLSRPAISGVSGIGEVPLDSYDCEDLKGNMNCMYPPPSSSGNKMQKKFIGVPY